MTPEQRHLRRWRRHINRADKTVAVRRRSPARWALQYGVWILLGSFVLVWELIAVLPLRALVHAKPRNHPTLSELVWRFEARFGLTGRGIVLVALLDLACHFLFKTSLIPVIG